MRTSFRAYGFAVSLAERAVTFGNTSEARSWLARVAHHHRSDLRRALSDVGAIGISLKDDREVERLVAELLASGRIVATEYVAKQFLSDYVGEPEEEDRDYLGPEDRAPVEEQTTFITINVVRDDDMPLPNVPYRLALPNGAVREGKTNADGQIHLEDLPHGLCRLTISEHDIEKRLGTGAEHPVVIEEDWDFDLNIVPTPEHPAAEEQEEEADGRWDLDSLAHDPEAA